MAEAMTAIDIGFLVALVGLVVFFGYAAWTMRRPKTPGTAHVTFKVDTSQFEAEMKRAGDGYVAPNEWDIESGDR
jgi:hypothetical protein